MNVERQDQISRIDKAFATHHVVAMLGPRQCGKTTLARMYLDNYPTFKPQNYFDLEDPQHHDRLTLDPKLALESLEGLIVIDEIQRVPELFPLLRVLVDRKQHTQRYLILGSASRELIQQSSESLAGRISYLELTPFSYYEGLELKQYWLRGGFPSAYLAETEEASVAWRKAYIRTYLEQDIPNLGLRVPANRLRRFWMMLANYHGQTFNASELAKSLGVTSPTAKHYFDILVSTFMVRELLPWYENIKKRQVKSPKLYFRDTGIYHTLLNINGVDDLLMHPKLGSSWEGLALEEIIRYHRVDAEECFYWSVHNEAELDLLLFIGGKRVGFEFKYTSTPRLTKSARQVMTLLKLDELFFISPGQHEFQLDSQIKAIGLEKYIQKTAI